MSHVGYLQLPRRVFHFDTARCRFSGDDLDLEAEGKGIKFSLLGILLPRATKLDKLQGREWFPTEAEQSECADALNESAIEIGDRWLIGQKITRVACRTFDPENHKIALEIAAEYQDSESEKRIPVEGTFSCEFIREYPPEHFGLLDAMPRLHDVGVTGIHASSARADVVAALGQPEEEGGNTNVHGCFIYPWLKYRLPACTIRFEFDSADRINVVSFFRTG